MPQAPARKIKENNNKNIKRIKINELRLKVINFMKIDRNNRSMNIPFKTWKLFKRKKIVFFFIYFFSKFIYINQGDRSILRSMEIILEHILFHIKKLSWKHLQINIELI